MSEPSTWGDLYTTPPQVVELDRAGKGLLSLVPTEMHAQAEPQLRAMLVQVRLQLGERDYLKFCDDITRAVEFHRAGERERALELFALYGYGSMYDQACNIIDAQTEVAAI